MFIDLSYFSNLLIVYLTAPEVESTMEYGTDTVTVLLQMFQQYIAKNISYSVSVEPVASVLSFGNSTVQIIVSYNIVYNVSVVASLCGHNSSATVLELHFGKS